MCKGMKKAAFPPMFLRCFWLGFGFGTALHMYLNFRYIILFVPLPEQN